MDLSTTPWKITPSRGNHSFDEASRGNADESRARAAERSRALQSTRKRE